MKTCMRCASRVFALLLGLHLLLENCEAQERVRFSVTSNFEDASYGEEVAVTAGDTVLGVLSRQIPVETSLGGGFVKRIQGLPAKPDPGRSWFYYVNGTLAHLGARSFTLGGGEDVHWDYHAWESGVFIPAIVGSYPEPFRSGYRGERRPTVILADKAHIETAGRLGAELLRLGAKEAEARLLEASVPHDSEHYYIVVASWMRLQSDPRLSSLYKSPGMSGFHVRFLGPEGIEALDFRHAGARRFRRAGVILPLSSGFGGVPLWLISGTGEREVEGVLALLLKEPQRIRRRAAVLLSEGEVYGLPVE